jgi:hypothetical protein
MKYPRTFFVLATVFLFSSATAALIAAGTGAQPQQQGSLASQLIGTWVFVENIEQSPVAPGNGRLMIYTGRNWIITQADSRTHEVIFHHGGTYTLRGDELVVSVDYAMQSTRTYIGTTRRYRVSIEGDTLTKVALDGNPFSEVWKRGD